MRPKAVSPLLRSGWVIWLRATPRSFVLNGKPDGYLPEINER